MHIVRDYKTAQLSSALIDELIIQDNLENYFSERLSLYDFIKVPVFEEKDGTRYLVLYFNTKSSVRKIGFNCSPNGVKQKLCIAQNYTVINDEINYSYNDFLIGVTGIFEAQVENILLPDKETTWSEGLLYTDIYSIKLPLGYTYDIDKYSKIDFVFDYAYDVTA